jgi:hypothetical protein
MKILVHFVVIVILVRQSMSNWILKWEDEFDNETIDTNKWEIENESGHCKGIFFLLEMTPKLVLYISMAYNLFYSNF